MITAALMVIQLNLVPALPLDPWFGEDKLKHFFTSFLITSLSASGSRAAGVSPDASHHLGVGVAGTFGVLKEVHDARTGGPFSLRDLVWDAAGIGGAALLLSETR